MSSLISLHTYLMINVAIGLSYLTIRLILKSSFISTALTQLQQLRLARKALIITLVIFFLTPFILARLPVFETTHFQFAPILKHASVKFLEKHSVLSSQIEVIQSPSILPSINILLIIFFLIGFSISLTQYLANILNLKKISKRAHHHRQINNISILFSETAAIPFCWSFLNSHFVILPHSFLQKSDDLKFAIRHELQHLRQKDTYWLHLLAVMNFFCFWNPLFKSWCKWFKERQEFACDESLILHKNTSCTDYAQCLINTASTMAELALPRGVLGIIGSSKKEYLLLNRRVTMLFDYKKLQNKKVALICAYVTCFFFTGTLAYALTSHGAKQPLTTLELTKIVKNSNLNTVITPEVLSEINNIRGNEQARDYIISSLERMKKYKLYIETQLKNNDIPNNLLALPLIESGYNVQAKSPMNAAGIWQFIPSTAKHFHLKVNAKQDDRLNTQLSTQAAINYLKLLYAQFNDWRLAVIAYEIGEDDTEELIKDTGSRDPWALVRSPAAPKELKKFLAMFDAAVIILNNPDLITIRG
ncbi:MAG: transglycosylase SLT domain-containing protein [Gammaproteobacteria bacterium]|nr:transglycosylase SLT domain-containing protein [Gammaproteobacteria bacterium]